MCCEYVTFGDGSPVLLGPISPIVKEGDKSALLRGPFNLSEA